MKIVVFFAGFLVIAFPANAKMYKCTDADGHITFKDQPCVSEAQEVLKEKVYAKPAHSNPTKSGLHGPDNSFTKYEPIKPLPGGKKVTNSSPLARVYMEFAHALNHCDRDGMIRYSSMALATALKSGDSLEFKKACLVLQDLLPGNFDDATEVVGGNTGTIQWLTVESSTTEDGITSSFKTEQIAKFVKEDGAWKFNGN